MKDLIILYSPFILLAIFGVVTIILFWLMNKDK